MNFSWRFDPPQRPVLTTVEPTVIEACIAVAELIPEATPNGSQKVHPAGVQELVAAKGYYSNDVTSNVTEFGVRTYIAEPERRADLEGKPAEKECANRRRIRGAYSKRLQRQRGEKIERNSHVSVTPGARNQFGKTIPAQEACRVKMKSCFRELGILTPLQRIRSFKSWLER